MKKQISILLIVLSVLTIFSPILANTNQSTQLSEMQLSNTIGGLPAAGCAALLAVCLAETDSWWADVLCMALTAFCLAV